MMSLQFEFISISHIYTPNLFPGNLSNANLYSSRLSWRVTWHMMTIYFILFQKLNNFGTGITLDPYFKEVLMSVQLLMLRRRERKRMGDGRRWGNDDVDDDGGLHARKDLFSVNVKKPTLLTITDMIKTQPMQLQIWGLVLDSK